jgi:ATP-dependent Clp protease ATP-binding subunit ClpA
MLLYDDTATNALHAAAEEARRSGTDGYETPHVLLGLLQKADAVTRTVTADHPQLTENAVRTALGAPSRQPLQDGAVDAPSRRSTREPAAEFRQAARRFTAKWRLLVRDRQLAPGRKLGTAELWLTVLEAGSTAAHLVSCLGADPEALRRLVLATMVPDGVPVPVWPTDVPAGSFRQLRDRLLGSGGRP